MTAHPYDSRQWNQHFYIHQIWLTRIRGSADPCGVTATSTNILPIICLRKVAFHLEIAGHWEIAPRTTKGLLVATSVDGSPVSKGLRTGRQIFASYDALELQIGPCKGQRYGRNEAQKTYVRVSTIPSLDSTLHTSHKFQRGRQIRHFIHRFGIQLVVGIQ